MRLRRSTGGLRASQAAGIVQSLWTVFRNRPTKNSGAGRGGCSKDIGSQLSVPAVRGGAITVCDICGTTEVVLFQSNLGLGEVLRTTRYCLCSLGNETADPPTDAALSKQTSARGFCPSPDLLASFADVSRPALPLAPGLSSRSSWSGCETAEEANVCHIPAGG